MKRITLKAKKNIKLKQYNDFMDCILIDMLYLKKGDIISGEIIDEYVDLGSSGYP